MIKISKGLDIPISGMPSNEVENSAVRSVGVVASDYPGLKPTMMVNIGDTVRAGDKLFENKKNPGSFITSPGSGTIAEINRGEKRKFLSISIDLDDSINPIQFDTTDSIKCLEESGYFAFFKTRPFNRVPNIGSKPTAIFVNACDTNPLAVSPNSIIKHEQNNFDMGLNVISNIFETDVPVFCSYLGEKPSSVSNINFKEFKGKHPAGLVGTQVHFTLPVSLKRQVWTIGYQEVIAIGHLFTTGNIKLDKYVSLGGEGVYEPKILKTNAGANIDQLTAGKIKDNTRVIAGSVLNGIHAKDVMSYVGAFDNQISVLPDEANDILFNWAMPGSKLHSQMGAFLSSWIKPKKFIFNTSINGGNRAIVPLPPYEEVMPLNILATQLLKALVTKDIELGVKLGVLELAPEDLALSSYVCPSKYDYQTILQENLDLIFEEMA